MVIPIAIGQYSQNREDRKRAGCVLRDLDGISKDIENAVRLFGDDLRYDVFPDYHGQNGSNYKVQWNRDELVHFLEEQAKDLERNLKDETSPSYDALIVLLSVK